MGFDADLVAYVHWALHLKGLSENTIRVRVPLLQRLHLFLGFPLRDAQPGHLLRFERLAIAGRSPETRRSYVVTIRAFYRWCLTTGILSDDPSTLLTIPVVPKHLPRPISEDDLALALGAARPKMRAILVLAAYAGLRAIEISGLEWTDVHREQDGTMYIHVRRGKGKKERNVEVGETVIKALQAHGFRRRGPIFLGSNGGAMDARSVSRSCNRFLEHHGIDATLHQLRHRFGTVGYQLTRDLRLIQEQMGHSSPQTTAGYSRVSADAARRLVMALDALSLPAFPTTPLQRKEEPYPARGGEVGLQVGPVQR